MGSKRLAGIGEGGGEFGFSRVTLQGVAIKNDANHVSSSLSNILNILSEIVSRVMK